MAEHDAADEFDNTFLDVEELQVGYTSYATIDAH